MRRFCGAAACGILRQFFVFLKHLSRHLLCQKKLPKHQNQFFPAFRWLGRLYCTIQNMFLYFINLCIGLPPAPRGLLFFFLPRHWLGLLHLPLPRRGLRPAGQERDQGPAETRQNKVRKFLLGPLFRTFFRESGKCISFLQGPSRAG